jgi:hypothetical protein
MQCLSDFFLLLFSHYFEMAKIIVSDGVKLKINECIQLANDNAHNGVKQKLEKLLDAKYVNLDSLKDLKDTFKQYGIV